MMDPMTEAEIESGCEPGELAGTFPANMVSGIRRTYGVGRIDMDQEELFHSRNGEWTTSTLQEDFEILGFLAPFVTVRRRYDGKKGSLEFSHAPRLYWGFQSSEDY